jgi:hypothetical protein
MFVDYIGCPFCTERCDGGPGVVMELSSCFYFEDWIGVERWGDYKDTLWRLRCKNIQYSGFGSILSTPFIHSFYLPFDLIFLSVSLCVEVHDS